MRRSGGSGRRSSSSGDGAWGDLHVCFDITFPEVLSEKQQRLVRRALLGGEEALGDSESEDHGDSAATG